MNAIIIIPTYNEKGNIEKLIETLEKDIFPKITDHQMGILVVDDTSPDGTAREVEQLMKKYKNLHLLKDGKKEGLGAAYVRGMTEAIEKFHADVLMEMDADGQHEASKIPDFLSKIDEGYDFVNGTRYSGGGSIPKTWGLDRKFLSVFGNITIRVILMRFSIHDWTGGYRAIKKEVFLKEKSKLKHFTGYTFQVGSLLNAVQDGFKIAEVPFHFSDRTIGSSKIPGTETIINTLMFVIFARIKELTRVIKFLIVGGTGFIVQLASQEAAVFLGISHAFSGGIGAETAIISNFMFNHFWTFQDTKKIKQNSNFFMKLLKFNTSSLASIVIQIAAIWLGEKLLGVSISLGSFHVPTRIAILFPTIIFIIIPLNYLIYNKLIWKTQYLKTHGNLDEA